jgi:hypothetical protein
MACGLVLSFLALTKVRKIALKTMLGIAEGWEEDIVDGFEHSLWLGAELGIDEDC